MASILPFVLFLTTFLLPKESFSASVKTLQCGQIKTSSDQFPWNVGIYDEKKDNELKLVCFGTLIAANVLLTAAHCFCDNLDNKLRSTSFYVNLDENLHREVANSNKDLIKVENKDIVIHDKYDGIKKFLAYDLAIVKIDVPLNERVRPVCIDWSADIHANTYTSRRPTWDSPTIKKLDLLEIEGSDCSYDAPTAFQPFITPDKSCIKNNASKPHHCDEGAGVVFLNKDNLYYLKGVVSIHQSSTKQLSTYTKINQYLNWISNVCANL